MCFGVRMSAFLSQKGEETHIVVFLEQVKPHMLWYLVTPTQIVSLTYYEAYAILH